MSNQIKITDLSTIPNANLTTTTVFPGVNMVGTPITQKITLHQVGNFILSNAGLANLPPASLANTAYGILGSVANIRIFGGNNQQVLTTDGAGNLSWATVVGGGGNGVSNGSSNISIPIASGNIVFVSNATPAMTISNNSVIIGNGSGGNISGVNSINAIGNITAPFFIGNVIGNVSGIRRNSPSLRDTFDQAVAGLNPVENYVFGNAVIAGPNETRISNFQELETYFNPYEDFTGRVRINSEHQRYQPFNGTSHVFSANKMDLIGALPGNSLTTIGAQVTATTVTLDDTPNPIAAFGLINTTGIFVGQLVAIQYVGLAYVSALVEDTSISLLPLAETSSAPLTFRTLFFLQAGTAVISEPTNTGSSTIVFDGPPGGLQTGYQIGKYYPWQPLTSDETYIASNISGNSIQIDRQWTWDTLGIGDRVIYCPLVTSGQIWSKSNYDISDPDMFYAMDFELDLLPGAGAAFNTKNIDSLASFNAAPNDVPWGAWPALWMWSADDGTDPDKDASEIDLLEMWWSSTAGPRAFFGYDLNGTAIQRYNRKNDGWTYVDGFENFSPTPLNGVNRFSLVYSNNHTYRYINGRLIKKASWQWTSEARAQIGINLGIGSFRREYVANIMFPLAASNFSLMRMGIRRIRVWSN